MNKTVEKLKEEIKIAEIIYRIKQDEKNKRDRRMGEEVPSNP